MISDKAQLQLQELVGFELSWFELAHTHRDKFGINESPKA